ncbi:DNA cytosine methyltransferase [Chitinophaga silvisoli]|uniref:Cytosine-specific methyltransferase n=1 Tax=Chitinophaga silvisoli TaxID=2291814 RepID=A0A3E1P487_9BACT|nr:DNA cytosine methyltransferase [Chitinophaga silvisoli]RFM35006.1 DNA cytosine methyltransferase [Chitinophaga silvisoli]
MRTVDLFAGCGGMSLGFQKAGFEIISAFDNWKEAVACYSSNFDHNIEQIDLADAQVIINKLNNTRIDIIIGGPPCQDFSHAGKRTEGSRADLTDSFAEIVIGLKPQMYVMENVDRAQKSKAYKSARKKLAESGYGITEVILDASYCGVPQKRKRFFSIGKLEQEDNFLLPVIKDMLSERPTTLRDYFGDRLGLEYYYRHPRNYSRRGIFSIDEPAPTIRGVNRPVPAGYVGHPGDPIPLNDALRPLTFRERAQIQTFPEDFVFNGSKTSVEQMIGNAVPVDLAMFVGNAIRRYNTESAKEKKTKGKEVAAI